MLGASFDSVEDNRAFAEKYGFPFLLLSDPTRAMGVAYGAAPDTSAAHAARVGVIIGPDGHVLEWHQKVQPSAWPRAALTAIGG